MALNSLRIVRVLQRSGFSNGLNSLTCMQIRKYRFTSTETDFNSRPDVPFDVSRNPEEWKYVERLLPKPLISSPTPKKSYPSGWWPQNPEVVKLPYYVERSKNHMIPVYMPIFFRGTHRRTVIRHIKGDIWLFEQDLRKYLESKVAEPIGSRIDEAAGKVSFRGDYVYYVTEWFKLKGF